MLRQSRVEIAGKAVVEQTGDDTHLWIEISNQQSQLEIGLVAVLQEQRHPNPLDPSPLQHPRLAGIRL